MPRSGWHASAVGAAVMMPTLTISRMLRAAWPAARLALIDATPRTTMAPIEAALYAVVRETTARSARSNGKAKNP